MTTEQAAAYVFEVIKTAKASMLANGIADVQVISAACHKLASMLDLDLDMVIALFEIA